MQILQDATQLTPAQQIHLVGGGSFFGSARIPEAEIPRLQLLDGGTGMNFEQLFGDFLSDAGYGGIGSDALRAVLANFYTPENLSDDESKALYHWIHARLQERFPAMTPPGCYPPGILLGATWSPEAVGAVGEALGMEARAYGVNVLLGTPNVNLHRDVRNGRLFEGYSEDPCLVSALAPALVKGVQKYGVAANVKHFAANNQETNRLGINETISERALQELYFPGFHACVDAGVATVMSAYNCINGVPCTENRGLLTDLLRDQWGYQGPVISDWGAVYHPVAAIHAGNDLQMPGPVSPDVLTEAYENGTLDPERLTLAAQRMLDLVRQYARPAQGEISVEETDQAAYQAAAEGIVMLKNNGCCPLSAHANIALYGEKVPRLLTCGEGSAGIHTTRNIALDDALSTRFASVSLRDLSAADTLVYVYDLPGQEGNDRKTIGVRDTVAAEWQTLLAAAEEKEMRKILLLNVAAPVALGDWEQRFDGIFCLWLPGMQGANAIADILAGKVNPSGKLPLSWPACMEQMPTFLNFPGDGMQVCYGEGIFVGYRGYDRCCIEPQYPFGYGLSYSDFAIDHITTDCDRFTDALQVSVTVRNISQTDGKTVLQLYISDPSSTLTKPVRELKAFRKLLLHAGEAQTVSFTLTAKDFASYDPNLHTWVTEEGTYQIAAGFSSREIQASCTVYADVTSPYTYGAHTSVKVMMETAPLMTLCKAFFAKEGLPWSAMLSSYEYTAQDTVSKIIHDCGGTDAQAADLYRQMAQVPKP